MITVVAGILRDDAGRVLLTQRLPGKHLAGSWEFPGGKCEPGETPISALVRELGEELGIEVATSRPVLSLTHHYPDQRVRLLIREVDAWQGKPFGREGQPLRWVALDDMADLAMPAADRPIVRTLDLDARYAITPDPVQAGGIHGLIQSWQACLDAGYRLLQLRAHSLDSASLARLAERLGNLARPYRARWLLNGPADIAVATGADGLHLRHADLASHSQRPVSDELLLAASCHDADSLARAAQLGADFVCLSPVRATASHHQARPLGWDGFAALSALSALPVLALGGVKPEDLGLAREHGAWGVAGISAFGGS